jgi:hypothetical protein
MAATEWMRPLACHLEVGRKFDRGSRGGSSRGSLVVTNSTFVGRMLSSEGAAILVDPTPASIANGMIEGLTDRGREMGSIAAQIVREGCSWPAVARRFLDQVEPLL